MSAVTLYARETAGFDARVASTLARLQRAAVAHPGRIGQATSLVAEVCVAGDRVDAAVAGQSAGLSLDRQLDVWRGDWIATPDTARETNRFSATRAWLDTEPAVIGRRYAVRHGNRWMQARIAAIESRLDIHSLRATDAHELAVNEIGLVVIETQQPLPIEAYASNRVGGSLVIVDPASNRNSGALLVREAA